MFSVSEEAKGTPLGTSDYRSEEQLVALFSKTIRISHNPAILLLGTYSKVILLTPTCILMLLHL